MTDPSTGNHGCNGIFLFQGLSHENDFQNAGAAILHI
jgi:hypothetical protein